MSPLPPELIEDDGPPGLESDSEDDMPALTADSDDEDGPVARLLSAAPAAPAPPPAYDPARAAPAPADVKVPVALADVPAEHLPKYAPDTPALEAGQPPCACRDPALLARRRRLALWIFVVTAALWYMAGSMDACPMPWRREPAPPADLPQSITVSRVGWAYAPADGPGAVMAVEVVEVEVTEGPLAPIEPADGVPSLPPRVRPPGFHPSGPLRAPPNYMNGGKPWRHHPEGPSEGPDEDAPAEPHRPGHMGCKHGAHHHGHHGMPAQPGPADPPAEGGPTPMRHAMSAAMMGAGPRPEPVMGVDAARLAEAGLA